MSYDPLIVEGAKAILAATVGVIFTTWYKDMKQKKTERKNLFLRMIAAKSFIKMPQMQINDMNMIELLFSNEKTIISKYQLYYNELCTPDDRADYEKQKALYWDLLREMGSHVGYKNLDNQILNKRYIPKGAMDDHMENKEFQATLLKYLTLGIELHTKLIEIYKDHPAIALPPSYDPKEEEQK